MLRMVLDQGPGHKLVTGRFLCFAWLRLTSSIGTTNRGGFDAHPIGRLPASSQ
jgi:hypothetical protein